MSRRYKIIFGIRFFGYATFLTGLLGLIFLLGPLITAELQYRSDRILGVKRSIQGPTTTLLPSVHQTDGGGGPEGGPDQFGHLSTDTNVIVPVDTNYAIVIEKINANARIIANVDPGDENAYVKALSEGVAEAAGSTPPGQPGNLYLFSHSTDAPWNVIRYNAIFFLLRELDKGDRVVIFYKSRRYDYIVYDKVIANANDVSFLTNRYSQPVLTLQTCDPPGTLLHRLIVRAKLVNS